VCSKQRAGHFHVSLTSINHSTFVTVYKNQVHKGNFSLLYSYRDERNRDLRQSHAVCGSPIRLLTTPLVSTEVGINSMTLSTTKRLPSSLQPAVTRQIREPLLLGHH